VLLLVGFKFSRCFLLASTFQQLQGCRVLYCRHRIIGEIEKIKNSLYLLQVCKDIVMPTVIIIGDSHPFEKEYCSKFESRGHSYSENAQRWPKFGCHTSGNEEC
jgi:hypothetical protein